MARQSTADLSPKDRFSVVASTRLNNALSAIDRLAGCSNKTSYEYTPAQVERMEKELDKAVQKVKDAFAGKKVSASGIQL